MIKKLSIIFTCIIIAFVLVYASSIESCFYQTDSEIEYNIWQGKLDNPDCPNQENNSLNWSCPSNWSNGEPPKSNDIVIFNEASNISSYIDMDFQIYGMQVKEGYTATIYKHDEFLLKIGSEGLSMKNGTLNLEETVISPANGELLIGMGDYKDNQDKNKLVIEKVSFSCSEEVLESLSRDINNASKQPAMFLGSLFNNFGQSIPVYGEGIGAIYNISHLALIVLNFFYLILLFKLRRTFGYIRNTITKEPIKFTPFKILLGASTNISYRGLTDIEGRYSFPIIPGSYRIEITKEGYLPFSRKISIKQVDLFSNFIQDIDLEPNGTIKYDIKPGFGFAFKYKILPRIVYAYPLILLISIINLIYIVYGESNRLYIALSLSIYLIYLVLYFFNHLIKPKPQLFEVVDTENKLRIPNVLVKLIDYKNKKLIDTKITNHDGFFESSIHKGDIAVFISHPGYAYPSKISTLPLRRTIISSRELLIYKFKTHGRKRSIYLDPIKRVPII